MRVAEKSFEKSFKEQEPYITDEIKNKKQFHLFLHLTTGGSL